MVIRSSIVLQIIFNSKSEEMILLVWQMDLPSGAFHQFVICLQREITLLFHLLDIHVPVHVFRHPVASQKSFSEILPTICQLGGSAVILHAMWEKW